MCSSARVECVCKRHVTYCNGWLHGLKLEEDLASFLWTHCPYFILCHSQEQFTSKHPESVDGAAWNKGMNIISSRSNTFYSTTIPQLSLRFPHILEKPLYSSQALTCTGVEFMSRVTPPRMFCCEGQQRSWDDVCEICVVTQQSSGCHSHTGGSSTSPLLLIDSRTFCGMLPSSSRLLRTSHHCLDFWITCKNTTRAWVWTLWSSTWPQTTWTYFRGHC